MLRVLVVLMAALFVADVVAVAAVGRPPDHDAAAPNEGRPHATPPVAPIGTFRLTGLPAYPGDRLDRPALSVKIDNASDAHPQAGLNGADVVTEELVEGGLTRLLATFQSHAPRTVGPVRSARPEDATLVALVGGALAFSGASAGVLATLAGVHQIQPLEGDGIFYRDPSRVAPANLFLDTAPAFGAISSPPPGSVFSFTPTTHGPITPAVTLPFSGSSVAAWRWNPATSVYERSEARAPDVLADGTRVHTSNVVILSVAVTESDNYDVRGNRTPVEQVTGSGPCWVMRDGILITGTWSRATASDTLHLPSALRAGPTWVELLPRPFVPAFAA